MDDTLLRRFRKPLQPHTVETPHRRLFNNHARPTRQNSENSPTNENQDEPKQTAFASTDERNHLGRRKDRPAPVALAIMPSTRLTDEHSHPIHSLVVHEHHHPASIVADPLASLHDVITEEDVAAAQDVVDATVGGVLGEDEEEAAALRAGEEAAAAAMEGALGTCCVSQGLVLLLFLSLPNYGLKEAAMEFSVR